MDKSIAAVAIHVDGEKPTMSEKSTTMGSFDRVDSAITIADGTAANNSGVRVLALHEWKEAAASLAEAFAEDHSCRYFTHTPDTAHWTEEQRWQLHVNMMEYIVYAHLLKGLVVSAGPNYDCVGLW
jgi:hypothetical protein